MPEEGAWNSARLLLDVVLCCHPIMLNAAGAEMIDQTDSHPSNRADASGLKVFTKQLYLVLRSCPRIADQPFRNAENAGIFSARRRR
jgi:hypothetical protein